MPAARRRCKEHSRLINKYLAAFLMPIQIVFGNGLLIFMHLIVLKQIHHTGNSFSHFTAIFQNE